MRPKKISKLLIGTNNKGKLKDPSVNKTMGINNRQSMVIEQKRLAAKAAREARGR